MTTANADFKELMPHRIRVTGKPTQYNDRGKPLNVDNVRTYRCLIDDSTVTTRNADGTTVTVTLSAYIAPVPIDPDTDKDVEDGQPVDIEADEKVEILSPRPQIRPINTVERHYDSVDGVGRLHNIVLRLT